MFLSSCQLNFYRQWVFLIGRVVLLSIDCDAHFIHDKSQTPNGNVYPFIYLLLPE